jgi:hypothetical protein
LLLLVVLATELAPAADGDEAAAAPDMLLLFLLGSVERSTDHARVWWFTVMA